MKDLQLLLFTLILILIYSCTPNITPKPIFGDVVMRPYLQAVTDTSVTVMVESLSKKDIIVDFGVDGNFDKSALSRDFKPTTADPTTYVHRVRLGGLSSGTRYNYRLRDADATKFGGSFVTTVKPGNSFRFANMGDTRTNTDIHNAIAKLIHQKEPDLSLYSGDLCMWPSYSSFKHEFFVPNQLELAANVPFKNAVGNHEEWSQNTEAFTYAPESPSGEQYYYSFDVGDIHFLLISSEHDVDEGSEQWEFAREDLRNTKRKWKIAMFHEPAYCGGGHGEDGDMIDFAKGVLEPNGVDIVLTGHSHFYQRNEVNGLMHIVSAGGGAPLYTPKMKSYTIKQAKEHHFIIFDASPEKISATVYNIDDEIIDQFQLEK